MSGVPNVQQIRELRRALAEIEKEQKDIQQAQDELRHRETIISCANQRLAKQRKTVRELLDAMDCGPNGNYGSENRMIAMLTGLVSDAAIGARSEP